MKRNLNILLVGFISLILMLSACEKDKLKDISEETQNGIQLLYEDGEIMPVTPDVILPEGSNVSVEDVKVSSMISDGAEVIFSEVPTLVLGEDANGNTLLLAYAIPKTENTESKSGTLKTAPSNLELSIKSSAVALVMMRIGAVDPQSRTQLVEEIVKHSAFPALVDEMEQQFVQKPSFLDEVMNHETIVAAVRSISKDVFDAYILELQASSKSAVQRLKSSDTKKLKLSGAIDNFWRWSPWKSEEPWYWYGDANALDVTLPPFLAKSLKSNIEDEEKRFAIGNPTNINYIADIYEADTDKFLDYRYVGRNSTFIQKTVNSYAAQTPILTDVNFDEFEEDKVYKISIKKCLTQDLEKYYHWGCLGSHVFHVAESALNIVADGGPLGIVAEVFTSKHSVQIIVGAAEASLSSVNVGDFASASNIASLLETCVTILADEGVSLLLKDKIKSKSKDIVKKSVTKLTAKLTNPAGWALMAFEAVNDFVPLSVSLVSAPAKVDYYVNWSNGTVSEEYTPLSLKLTSPDDLAKFNESSVTLSWESTGNSFDVYWGTEEPLVEIASGITTKQFIKEDLTAGQTYFWKIIAHDDFGIDIESEVRSFSFVDNTGAPELLAFYPLTTDAKDYSGNGHDGTPYGGLSFGSAGASFDGINDRILLDNSLIPQNNYTVSMVIKADVTNEATYHDYLFFAGTSSTYMRIALRNDKLLFSKTDNSQQYLDIETPFSDISNNHFLTLTFKDNVLKAYIDGVFLSDENIATLGINSKGIAIGGHASDNNYSFNGYIKNVSVYNSALSDTQVTELHNNNGVPEGITLPNTDNGEVNLTNGLVAYYLFNGNANDVSGNNYDGDLGAGAQFSEGSDSGHLDINSQTDSYVAINNEILDKAQDFSVSAIVKINNTNKWHSFLSGANPQRDNEFHLGYSMDERNGWYLIIGNTLHTFDASNYQLNDMVFHHITVTRSGDKANLFIDGEKMGNSITVSDKILEIPSGGLFVGQDQDCVGGCFVGSESFNGSISKLRIYNRSINENEVTKLSNELPTSNNEINLTAGLVAYYPFNGNANDESGNGNDGVVNGASLTQDRKGNTNSAYSFDGVDDYIEIPHSDEFNLTEFTLIAWCRISETGEHGARLIHKWNNNSSWNTYNYGLGLGSNGYGIVGFKNLQPNVQGFGIEGNTNNNDNSWHQIIGCVKGGEFIKIYVDGVLEESNEITAVPEHANSPIRIGKTEDSINWYGCPKGDIDNIRIYNRVLNAAEIQMLYEQ